MSRSQCILDNLAYKPKPSEMSKGQAWQLERVRMDEKRKADAKYVMADRRDMFRAHWTECLEEASQYKRLRYELEDIKTELKLGNKTLIQIRRAQLQYLLKSEEKIYENELNSLGLTLYKERL